MPDPTFVNRPSLFLVRKDRPPGSSSETRSRYSSPSSSTSRSMSVMSKLQLLMFSRPSAVVLVEDLLDRMLAEVRSDDAAIFCLLVVGFLG